MTTLNSQQKQLYIQATTQFDIEAKFIDSLSAPKQPMIQWPSPSPWDSIDSTRQFVRNVMLWRRFRYRKFDWIRKQLEGEQTNLLFCNEEQTSQPKYIISDNYRLNLGNLNKKNLLAIAD